MMKTYCIIFLVAIAGTINLFAQNTYSLKNANISFSSSDEFINIYDEPDYALFKSQRIEVSLKLVAAVEKENMEIEISKKFLSNDFVVTQTEKPINTTNQLGMFMWASKMNQTEGYAKGLILVKANNKTVLVEIKYDIKKENEVKQITTSFFTGTIIPERNKEELTLGSSAEKSTASQAEVSQLAIAEKKAKEDAIAAQQAEQKKKEAEQQKAQAEKNTIAPVAVETIPAVPDKNSTKHPKVTHSNLIALSQAQKQEFIDAHNRWRSDVGVPPIVWSDDLENFAADWAVTQGEKNCDMEHRSNNEYGENLYWSSGMAFSPTGVVDNWGSEIKDYHGEIFGQSNGVVGHYTQLVWRTTTEVGCAAFSCGSALLVVCNYNPSGNWLGTHPYKK